MLPPFDQKLVVKMVNPAAAEVRVAYPTIWCASARSRCEIFPSRDAATKPSTIYAANPAAAMPVNVL